ncbi:MAG: permease-like cell division protein FtsX [bacterium]|nr:permease-like cell division protein FtsX [bacterium]
MAMTAFKRIIRAGFLNFRRSGLVSWAAVLVVTITLSVITSIILFQAVLHFSLSLIKEKVDIKIYLTDSAPEENIILLKESLEQLPEITDVTYTSADEELRMFRERHAKDYPTIQALDELGDNPLLANLGIKAKEVAQYENIANFLASDGPRILGSASYISKTNYHENKVIIDRLNGLISGGYRLGFLITLLLVLVSIVITFNTIRLTIFISKEEIGVMRLVGASKMHVRGPFMIEGAIYGVIATLITLFLFLPATVWLGSNMSGFLGINMYDYYVSNIFQISAILMLSGVSLGIISSFLAVRKYLNK